ncbi:MAG TPA: hypothetical protein VMD59_12220, partial [Acidimicrobiales bacterium]|nr:hypothetical protein [Acidimicrobiales bacterium]
MSALVEITPGVLVTTSQLFLTTTTVLACRGGCVVVDPAATAAELGDLAAGLHQRGMTVSLGVATHAHWDHLLWCRPLGAAPRYGSERAVSQARRERSSLVAEMEPWAPGHDLELFGEVLALRRGETALPSPAGSIAVLEHDGHA